MTTMTRKQWLQELLTRARDGRFPSLAKGAFRSDPNRLGCAYRTPEGNACAVGILIPDDKYRASFEGHLARRLLLDGEVPFPEWATHEVLAAAQDAHDNTAAPYTLGHRVPGVWNPEAFLQRLRGSPVLSRAFAEEGLVIE